MVQLGNETARLSVARQMEHLAEHPLLAKRIEQKPANRESLRCLRLIADGFQMDVDGFFEHVALMADTDTYDARAEKVALMTMHASKGLEFPVVFIAGCERDLIPYDRGNDQPVNLEEERRLFYVAMTRARERLYLTWAAERRIFGQSAAREISPFVTAIEKDLRKDEGSFKKKRSKTLQVQLQLF